MSHESAEDGAAAARAAFGAGLLRQLSGAAQQLTAGLTRTASRADLPASAASLVLSRASSDDMVDCPVCISTLRSGDLVTLCDAGHRTCCPCALHCIRDELQPGRSMLLCPFCKHDPGRAARGHMAGWVTASAFHRVATWSRKREEERGDVHAVAAEEELRFEERCASAALLEPGTAPPLRIMRCPHTPCGQAFAANVREAGDAPEVAQCPHCTQSLCAACGKRWVTPVHADGDDVSPDAPLLFHVGMPCAAYAAAIVTMVDTVASTPAILGSSMADAVKPCPNCGTGIVHARGHACHHIKPGSGCPNCKSHFCFVCLSPYPCGNGCPVFCDDTCDCSPCLECKPSHPCAHCDGDSSCPSCHPVPQHQQAARAASAVTARALKVSRGWCGPRRVPPTHAYTGLLGISLEQVRACVAALNGHTSACGVECAVATLCSMAGTRTDSTLAHIVAARAIAHMCDAVERLPLASAVTALRAALQCISSVMTGAHARTCVCEQSALAIVMRALERAHDDVDTTRRALDVLSRAAAAADGDEIHIATCTSVWYSVGGTDGVCAHVERHLEDAECTQAGANYIRLMLGLNSQDAHTQAEMTRTFIHVMEWMRTGPRDVNTMCALVALGAELLPHVRSAGSAAVDAHMATFAPVTLAVCIEMLHEHADRVEEADSASAAAARQLITFLAHFQPWHVQLYERVVNATMRAGVRTMNSARAGVVVSILLSATLGMLAVPTRDWTDARWLHAGVNTALVLAFAGSYRLLRRSPRYDRLRQEIRTSAAGWGMSVGVLSAAGWLLQPGGYVRATTDFCHVSWLAWTAAYALPALMSIATLSDARMVWRARHARV